MLYAVMPERDFGTIKPLTLVSLRGNTGQPLFFFSDTQSAQVYVDYMNDDDDPELVLAPWSVYRVTFEPVEKLPY